MVETNELLSLDDLEGLLAEILPIEDASKTTPGEA